MTEYKNKKGSWRPTRSHEYIFMFVKDLDYYCDGEAVLDPFSEANSSYTKWLARYNEFLSTGVVPEEFHKRGCSSNPRPNNHGKNKLSIWEMSYKTVKSTVSKHTAPYPLELPDICIKASTSPFGCCSMCGKPYTRRIDLMRGKEYYGYTPTLEKKYAGWHKNCDCDTTDVSRSVVLDMFNGSGSTGIVAIANNCDYIGIDISQEYLDDSRARMMDETYHAEQKNDTDIQPELF